MSSDGEVRRRSVTKWLPAGHYCQTRRQSTKRAASPMREGDLSLETICSIPELLIFDKTVFWSNKKSKREQIST